MKSPLNSTQVMVLKKTKDLIKELTEALMEEVKSLDMGVSRNRVLLTQYLYAVSSVYKTEMRSLIKSSVAEYLYSELPKYEKTLIDAGIKSKAIETVVETTLKKVGRKFKGYTLTQRVNKISRNLIKSGRLLTLKGVSISDQWLSERGRIVRFGSVLAQSTRLIYSEMNRALQEAVKEMLSENSEKILLKWTLSPLHEVIDICDDFAEYVDPESGINIPGVYTVENFPEYPHPYCRCTPTILFKK